MPTSATELSSVRKTLGAPKDYLPAMPVIVGAPRSGTTLLRLMLDAHPDVAIPPETGFLAQASALKSSEHSLNADQFVDVITNFPPEMPTWPDFEIAAEDFRGELSRIQRFNVADGFRAFYRMYAGRFGKSRWGDKTPGYVLHITDIAEILPEAHFIHIIRDGRDVSLSWRQCWFAPSQDMKTLAAHWQHHVAEGRRQGARCGRYLEVRYEILVRRSAEVLKEVCAFLGLPYVEQMERYHERAIERLREHHGRRSRNGRQVIGYEDRLQQQRLVAFPPDSSRIDAWKATMTAAERTDFEAVAGDLLRDLEYEA
jgi:sulfotransferase family protein